MDSSVNLQPSEIPEALNIAIQHFNDGDLSQAKDVFNRILKTDPREENALHLLGVVYFKEGDNEKARELITKALDTNHQFPAAHNNLGSVYKVTGHLDEAATCYRKAIECQGDFAMAHYNLGNVLKDLHQSTEAEASYQKAIDLNPDYADAHHNLGYLYLTNKQFDKAIECFRKVIAIYPDYIEAYYNIGSAFKSLDRIDEAIESYRRILVLDPKHLKAQYSLLALTDNLAEAPPEGYVASAFDYFAHEFEHQMAVGNCRIPEILRLLAGKLVDERKILSGPPFARVLDMGCGTGLAGVEFRDIAGELHGVDLSEKMLERARDKNVYAAVYQTDNESYLSETNVLYDLILAADVLIYTGPLEDLFAKVAARLEKGGMFAFSVERLDEGTYVLQASTRYAHSEEYVLRLARGHGFNVVYNQPVEKMRNDVNGILFWLEKED